VRALLGTLLGLSASAVLFVATTSVAALWPGAPDRVRDELASKDVARRRVAAAELATVPRREALPLLSTALADPDVEVRLAAADVAARLRALEVESVILAWRDDPDPRLREAVCAFFARVPSARVVKVLARALGDPEARIRLAAVRALGASGSSEAVAPLLARLDDGNSKVRLAVARALGKLADPRAVTPLVSKVQDEASEVRQAVVRALGELGDPKSGPALVIALRDAAIEVRLEALSALARLRALDAVPSIAPLASEPAKKPGSGEIRRAALAALGRIGTRAAIEAIVRTFGQFEDERAGTNSSPAREAAVAAGPEGVPILLSLLSVDEAAQASVVSSAAWVLGELEARDAGTAIVGAMRRGALPLPVALRALAALGDPAHLPVCLEHVAAADRTVRGEALSAAARLLDPDHPDGRAVEPLLASLDLAKTTDDRAEIAQLLGRTGSARAVEPLVGLAASKEERLRVAAIDALGTLRAPQAGPPLLRLLSDPSPVARMRAATALGKSGGPEIVRPTIALLGAAAADRLAAVVAASGLLERHASIEAVDAAVAAVSGLGPERDLLVVGIGRSRAQEATARLEGLRNGAASDRDGRAAIAVALGARRDDPRARTLLRALAEDPDATVRAQAIWSLGAVGGASELPVVVRALADPAPAIAANAAAAIGRIGARAKGASPPELCAALDDDRPYVRANALSAVRLLGAASTCEFPRVLRMLAEDPNEVVRAAAARTAIASSGGEDPVAKSARGALERCALADPSGTVATVCREQRRPKGEGARTLIVFVAPDDGGAPVARAAYALERPDGLLHVGNADRRGAVVELGLGEGVVQLRVAIPANGRED
jgi:HEAT repeat protein